MSDIGNSLISAMQQIVDKTIERTPTDVTITATIKRLVEAARNKYEISYGGGIAYAYSDNGASYLEGQAVYVLVPQGDYTNKKIILGKAQEEYGDDTLADDLTAMTIGYNSVGGNLLIEKSPATVELDAGKKQDIKLLYGSDTFVKNESIDENKTSHILDLDSLSNSIKLADYLMITMDINTDLGAALRKSVTGKYGLKVAVIYNDPLGKQEVTRFYSLTDKDMFGNPMKYEQGSTQHIIFPIEKENFIRIEYIYAYCEDFVEEDLANSVSKIYFKNIQLQLLAPITSRNGDYYLQLRMPKGNTFKMSSSISEEEDDVLEVVNSVHYKKNSISDSCDHYWGIEDFSIDYNSKGYNKFLGNGWKLLTTSNTSLLKVFRKDNTAYQNNYVCVSVYNDNGTNIVLRETFSIFNDDNKIDIFIESDCGTSFSFNSGTPRLTCRAFIPVMVEGEEKQVEIGKDEAYPFSDYRFNWTKEDADGVVSFTKTPEQWKAEKDLFLKEVSESSGEIKTDSQGRTPLQITAYYNNEIAQAAGVLEKQDNYIKYSMKNIPATTNSTVFKCSIQKRKGSTNDWLNAGSASITLNNDVLGNNNCQIVIENGIQTFQYSETGISPASEKNQDPIEIRPLRAKFFTANGEEVPESRLSFIRWIIPSESTMINVSSDALTLDPLSGEQYVTSSVLDFSISEIYNLNTINNQIICSIGFDGKVYRQPTNFFFTKIGQVGTNGTQTTVKIEETSASSDRHSAIIVKPDTDTNSVSYSATLFTHNEKLFGYSPKWSIAGSDTKESRYIKIDGENNVSLVDKNKNKEDVRIVTAKIPYEGKTYYSSYPVYTITYEKDVSTEIDDIYIKKPNTLQFITYNSNGTNPQFNTAQGGIFLNVKTNKDYYVRWSALGGKDDINPAITLSRTSNSNVGTFVISEKTVTEDGRIISEIAKIKGFIQEDLDSILTQEIKDQTEILILNFFNQLNDSFYGLEANIAKCRAMIDSFKAKIESYEESYFKNSVDYVDGICVWLEMLLDKVKEHIDAVKEKNNAKNNTKNEIEKIFNSLSVENKEETSEQPEAQNETGDGPKSDKDLYITEYQNLLDELCNTYENNLHGKIDEIVEDNDEDFGKYKTDLLPSVKDFREILKAANTDSNYDTRELNDKFKEEIEKLRTSFESIVLEFDDITPPWFEKLVYIEKAKEESEHKEHSIFIVPAETYNGIYCNNRVKAEIMETVNTNNSDGTTTSNEIVLATVIIPIHLSLNAYELASVNGWDGTHIEINEEEGYLLSPQLGAGVKNPETNSFTGLVMGSISNKTEGSYSSEKVGLMGFSEGRQSIFLDAKTGAAEFGLAADGADSNDPYSEGRIKLVPNGVSEISKWRIGSKSLYNVKEGNISDAYLDLKQPPLDKNGYEKSVPHDKMGILLSADPSYISIKGKQLFEGSGIDFSNANAVVKPGDTMELQLDPNQFSLFTVFRHTSKVDGFDDYKLQFENDKPACEEIIFKDGSEEENILVYKYLDDANKEVYFQELVFPAENQCKIVLPEESKEDSYYYPEPIELNTYKYEYDNGSNDETKKETIEIPLIYMGEEACIKKVVKIEPFFNTISDLTKKPATYLPLESTCILSFEDGSSIKLPIQKTCFSPVEEGYHGICYTEDSNITTPPYDNYKDIYSLYVKNNKFYWFPKEEFDDPTFYQDNDYYIHYHHYKDGKKYYHYKRGEDKTYCLPCSMCSLKYTDSEEKVENFFRVYKTFDETSFFLIGIEDFDNCIFESKFKFVNQVLVENERDANTDKRIGKPAWRREPKVGIDANGRFYTNSLKDNATALTIGNLGAFGASAADKEYTGAAFEIESKYGDSSNLLKIFTDSKAIEKNPGLLESTPIYISASGDIENEYTKPISFYGDRLSLNAAPGANKKIKEGAQSKLELGIVENNSVTGKKTTSPFARMQSDEKSFLELRSKEGLRGFSLKTENNSFSTSLGIQCLTTSAEIDLDALEKDQEALSGLKKQITQEEYNRLGLNDFTKEQITSVGLTTTLVGQNKDNLLPFSEDSLNKIAIVINNLAEKIIEIEEKEIPDFLTLQSSSLSDSTNPISKKSYLSVNHNKGARLSVRNGSQLLLKQIGGATNKLLFDSGGVNLSSSTEINIKNNAKINITSGKDGGRTGGTITLLSNEVPSDSTDISIKDTEPLATFDKSNGDLFKIVAENGTGKASLFLRGYNGTSQAAYLLSNGGTYILPTLYENHGSSKVSSTGSGVWYVDIAPHLNVPGDDGRFWTGQAHIRKSLCLRNLAGNSYGGIAIGDSLTITVPVISFGDDGEISFTTQSATISFTTNNQHAYQYPKFNKRENFYVAKGSHKHAYNWTVGAGNGTTNAPPADQVENITYLEGVSEWVKTTMDGNSYVTGISFS